MQRVLVIGPSGAGKSTFARQLGERTGLPVTHLDQLYWEPGWVKAENEVYLTRLKQVVDSPRWIIDGSNPSTLDLRLPRADRVVLFERSRLAALWRVAKRVIGTYGRVRADMAEGCPERFDWEFVQYIWTFERKQRPRIVAALDRHQAWPRTVVFRRDDDAEAFLRRLAVT